MSTKMIGNKPVYSMTSIVKEFLHEESKKEVQQFIFFLVRCNIIDKKVLRYTHRTAYSYSPSEWFAVRFKGHFYASKKKYKGEEINGTLYFDEFLARVLSGLYRYNGYYTIDHIMNKYFDTILLEIAMQYVPKIKQIEKEVKIQKAEKTKQEDLEKHEEYDDEERIKQARKDMLNGITNVIKSSLDEKKKRKQEKENK